MSRNDAAQELADAERAVATFRHPADMMEDDAKAQLIGQLADVLTPVWVFIAKGELGGTMAHRAWVVLHETRMDMLHDQSLEDYAKRAGVSGARIHKLISEFRAMIPAYRSPHQKSAASKAKMRAAALARANREQRAGVEGAR